jgi:hypothetical protein
LIIATYLGILLVGLGMPQKSRGDDPKWLVDFGSDLRACVPDGANLLSPETQADSQPPFAEVRQLADELTRGHISAAGHIFAPAPMILGPMIVGPTVVGPTIAAPQSAGVGPLAAGSSAIAPAFNSWGTVRSPNVQPPAIFTAWPENLQPIAKRPAASSQAELLPGVVSQAAYFPSVSSTGDGMAAGPLPGTKLVSLDPPAGSSGISTSAFSQLNHYLSDSNKPQSLTATSAVLPQLSVDTSTVTMVDDDTVKNAVGDPSGLFSAARLAWNFENLRLESGIGFSWNTWLDRSKPFFDVSNRENVVWNLSLLYYPMGDIPWRPFVLLGTGITQLNTLNNSGQENSATVYTGISHRN